MARLQEICAWLNMRSIIVDPALEALPGPMAFLLPLHLELGEAAVTTELQGPRDSYWWAPSSMPETI
jgi:hypothetical protein